MTEQNKIATIDVHELKRRLDADPQLCLIDVREMHEWQAGHIPQAIHIPKDELTANIATKIADHKQPIYLHCQGGVRSLYAADCLVKMGYQHVYSINGGLSAWAAEGYSVV